MTGKSKDLGEEGDDQQFTPTDWDWVMFLSGRIDTIETRYETFLATVVAATVACLGFIIACLFFRITYLGSSDSILDSNSSTIVIIVVGLVSVFACCVFLIHMEKKRKTEERVKPLKKCRNDIFNRLDDPNKILECYLNPVGKKGDENKRWLITILCIPALVAVYVLIALLLVKLLETF